ncbi:folylpolyglutamate synthase/dihydrofolate synthase family protein [soil metagenome]
MNYEEALAYIASLEGRGWRLGLDRMQAFVSWLGLEDFVAGREGCRFLHVAGTNGKGSVTAFLQSILCEAGHRAGAFFSPYVVDPRERVQIGRDLISEEMLATIVTDIAVKAESFAAESEFGGVTEFELKTAVGFEAWRRAKCDWVAVEVGLGGRLDATSVLTPAACAIVSIGLDHERILGLNEGEIAWEKAGILRPGVPCVVGEVSSEALRAIEAVASRVETPIWRMGKEIALQNDHVHTPRGDVGDLRPSIVGRWQLHNAALAAACALAAGCADASAIQRGVRTAKAPGRFQAESIEGRTVIFDGAHNAAAAEALAVTLEEHFPRRAVRLVTNMLDGHDPLGFYRRLPKPVRTYVAPIRFARALSVDATAQRLSELGWEVSPCKSAMAALKAAIHDATENDVVLVTGSNYLIGELLKLTA